MSQDPKPFIIAIPIYEGVDLLDVAPPYEIFCWMGEKWPERKVEVYLAAERRDQPIFSRDRFQLTPHKTFDELPVLPRPAGRRRYPGGHGLRLAAGPAGIAGSLHSSEAPPSTRARHVLGAAATQPCVDTGRVRSYHT